MSLCVDSQSHDKTKFDFFLNSKKKLSFFLISTAKEIFFNKIFSTKLNISYVCFYSKIVPNYLTLKTKVYYLI